MKKISLATLLILMMFIIGCGPESGSDSDSGGSSDGGSSKGHPHIISASSDVIDNGFILHAVFTVDEPEADFGAASEKPSDGNAYFHSINYGFAKKKIAEGKYRSDLKCTIKETEHYYYRFQCKDLNFGSKLTFSVKRNGYIAATYGIAMNDFEFVLIGQVEEEMLKKDIKH